MRPALLIIDMQRYFLSDADDPAVFYHKLIPNIRRALDAARAAQVPIVHLITRYRRDKSDWPAIYQERDAIWCLEGSEGVEVFSELEPQAGEEVVIKTRFSGFYNSALDGVLQRLDVDTLFITGFACDVCVRYTTLDAYNRGYQLVLVSDCVHSSREDTTATIQHLKWLTKMTEMPLHTLEEVWQAG